MSHPDAIDALAVARRILANPRTFRVSTLEELAMADCLIGLDQLLDAADARPTTNARLAAAIAALLRADEACNQLAGCDEQHVISTVQARDQALSTLKTIFETEFPQ